MNTPFVYSESEAMLWTGLPESDIERMRRESPDRFTSLTDATGRTVARCSLWHRSPPALAGEVPGIIGHFSAESPEAGAYLLEQASATLAQFGCTRAIGPMDGNTWRKYRLVVDHGTEPPFFLEPWNPAGDVACFRESGFHEFARYHSAKVPLPAPRDPRLDRVRSRLGSAGVLFRELDLANFETELRAIHALSLRAFRHNLLYTDLDWEGFHAQYEPVKPLLNPRYSLLAEREGILVGYLFGLPDVGGQSDRLVAKTLACDTTRDYAGLGAVLTELLHARAEQDGFEQVVHALEYEGNRSTNLTRRYGEVIRRYALFAKELSP